MYAAKTGGSSKSKGIDRQRHRCKFFQNGWYETALMVAAFHGQNEAVKDLIKNKADPNMQNIGGETALIYASRTGHIEVVKELIQNKADLNFKDRKGLTALNHALKKENTTVVKILKEAGANE